VAPPAVETLSTPRPGDAAASLPAAPSPTLHEMDHKQQVAALVAAGWTEEDAKVFAMGQVMREGMRLMMTLGGNHEQEYWKQWRGPDMDWEMQRKMMERQYRMQEAMEDLFGRQMPGMFGSGSVPLPPEKVRAARMIQMDYQLMQSKIQQDTGGIMFPEDRQALAVLEEERRRDLAAVLTPEELFEFEVRTSSTSMSLRHQLNGMEPTEEEFRAIFRLQQEVDLVGGPQLHGADEEAQRRYQEATERMKTELRETLGEERFRQYERNQDWSYGQLVNVAKRLELPRERVDQVYDLKDVTEHQLQQVRQNRDLSNEERQAALAKLGTETREDLKELLGERGLELYQSHGGNWLHQLR